MAERVIRAADEDKAIESVEEELRQPYGFFGRWETTATEVDVLGVEATTPGAVGPPGDGPLLLSVADAAKHLGVSRGMLYEMVNGGEITSVQIGRRRLISRQALLDFIEANSRTGR
jgi:excisionase family DNA binding protein